VASNVCQALASGGVRGRAGQGCAQDKMSARAGAAVAAVLVVVAPMVVIVALVAWEGVRSGDMGGGGLFGGAGRALRETG